MFLSPPTGEESFCFLSPREARDLKVEQFAAFLLAVVGLGFTSKKSLVNGQDFVLVPQQQQMFTEGDSCKFSVVPPIFLKHTW